MGLGEWGPLIAVSLAMFIGVLDSSMLNVAVPAIVADLDTDVTAVQGAITLYSMVMAALMLPGGKLGAIYGLKRLFTIGMAVYSVGTLLAAIAPTITVLVLGWSVVEGAAAALLLPLTFAIVVANYEGKRRAFALGVLAGVNASASAVGPILGGAFTTFLSWRWAFASEFLVAVLTFAFIPSMRERRLADPDTTFDRIGAGLSVLGVTVVAGGFILAGKYGWLRARRPFSVAGVSLSPLGLSPTPWLVLLGLTVLGVFVWWQLRRERRGESPLVPMRVLENGRFVAGTATFALRSVVLAGFLFVVPVFCQAALGYSAFRTGLVLLPFSVGAFVLSIVAPGWRERLSPKQLIQAGLAVMTVGVGLLYTQIGPALTFVALAVPMAVIGIGLGLVMAQLLDVTLSAVEAESASEASSVANSASMLGYSLGTAVVGSVMLSAFYGGIVDRVVQATGTQVSAGERRSLVTNLLTAREVLTEAERQAFLDGLSSAQREFLAAAAEAATFDAMRTVVLVLLIGLLLTLAASMVLPAGDTETEPPTAAGADGEQVPEPGRVSADD